MTVPWYAAAPFALALVVAMGDALLRAVNASPRRMKETRMQTVSDHTYRVYRVPAGSSDWQHPQSEPLSERFQTYDEAWTWILKHQGQSVDWAMKHEGYVIAELPA